MNEKEIFFKETYIQTLKKLSGNEIGAWGVLSPQGMIEHMTDSVGVAHGRIKQELQTPTDVLERVRAFALSDKEFKPDTKNSLMSDAPAPLRNSTIAEAITELENEIAVFLDFYKVNPRATHLNPFFGEFSYTDWLHILHKHATHHLKQFNLA